MGDVAQGGVDASLDSIFSEFTGDAGQTDDNAQDTVTTGDASSDSGSGDAATETDELNLPVDSEDEDFTDEEAQQTPEDEEGRRIVAKRRFDMIYNSHKSLRSLKEALGGDLPSAEQIKANMDLAADTVAMEADLESGDPERVGNFLKYWTNEAPQAIPALVERGIVAMRESAPEAFAELQGAFNENLLDGLYARAAQFKQANDPQFKDFVYAVQVLDWSLRGDYREVDSLSAPDPLDERLQKIQEAEQRQQEQRNSMAQAQTAQWVKSVNNSLSTVISTEVDGALKDLAATFESRPRLFNSVKMSLVQAAKADMKADRNWLIQFNRVKEQAMRTRDPRAVKSLTDLYQTRFARALKTHRREVIREATGAELTNNQSAHDRANNAAKRKEPSGGGSPKPLNANQALEKARSARDVDGMLNALFA